MTGLDGSVPDRRFSARQLAHLLEITSSVDCECPNHLSKLVESLVAFEDYSKDCESRDAEDREIHAMLYRTTARARGVMEEALIVLMQHENIEL